MLVAAQLGTGRCLPPDQPLTSGIMEFQCEVCWVSAGRQGRLCFPQLWCSGCCSWVPDLGWVPALNSSDPRQRCCSSPTLLPPQPPWQCRRPPPNLGTEKMQGDPLISSSSFTSFSSFLTPLLNYHLCGMPPPLLHFGSTVSLHMLS